MKHIKFIILLIISIFSTGCFCVKKLPQSKLNPTEYVFPLSKKALIDTLMTIRRDYFGFMSKHHLEGYMRDSDYFKLNFSNWEKNKLGGSYLYRKRDNGKNHSYNFKVKIDSLSPDNCRLKIICTDGNLCTPIIKLGDMWYVKYKPVPSTTIEEYEILRKIGKRLGVLNQMPLVSYPEGLTRDQIRMTYGYYQDFTYEEMFGEPQLGAEPEYTKKELKKRRKKGLPLIKFDYSRCK